MRAKSMIATAVTALATTVFAVSVAHAAVPRVTLGRVGDVQFSPNGSIYVTLENWPQLCDIASAGNQFVVLKAGRNGLTEDAVRNISATIMAAKLAGRMIQVSALPGTDGYCDFTDIVAK